MVNVYYQNTRRLNSKVADIYVGTTFSTLTCFALIAVWLESLL
jgi:hypothetical protein